jgi:glycosyltransferase involved in cell wall biosynthesis
MIRAAVLPIERETEHSAKKMVPVPRPAVCQVLHTLDVGGGEILAKSFALEHERQFEPVFAVLDDLGALGRELRSAGYTVELIGRRPGFDLRCARRLGRFFRRNQVAAIHAHQYGPLFYSALARLPFARTPIVFTEHGRDYPDYRRWKRVLANRLLLSTRDRFVAVGESVRRALIEYEGLSADQVHVIYNGSDLSAYDQRQPARAAVRKELQIAETDFVVIHVARLNRLKDHSTAVEAMRGLCAAVPSAKLLVVGEGEERPVIERLITEGGLSAAITLLGTRRDIPRLLQAADAFLLTSISEGIPLTLIEAMATGLPCVATRVGGIPEVVLHTETGLLAEARDATALAGSLERLALDPEMRRRMGDAGYHRVREHFDARVMHEAYARLYKDLALPRAD